MKKKVPAKGRERHEEPAWFRFPMTEQMQALRDFADRERQRAYSGHPVSYEDARVRHAAMTAMVRGELALTAERETTARAYKKAHSPQRLAAAKKARDEKHKDSAIRYSRLKRDVRSVMHQAFDYDGVEGRREGGLVLRSKREVFRILTQERNWQVSREKVSEIYDFLVSRGSR